MQVHIPDEEAAAFAARLGTEDYRREERDYKVAVHLVLSALLSEEMSQRADLPERIADVFGEPVPDLEALGLAADRQQFVKQATAAVSAGTVRGAMANLAGGKWGLAQFTWIPRAIQFELGPEVATAFRDLVTRPAEEEHPDELLAQRIEGFRDALDAVSLELEKKGGFLDNWHHFRESVAFVAVVLTGFDPGRYTFYSKGALKHGLTKYADEPWPKGSMGEIYEVVCDFVRAVAEELRTKGAPVEDLIDAQSFLWMSFSESKKAASAAGQTPGGQHLGHSAAIAIALDADAVAGDLARAAYWPEDRARGLIQLANRWPQLLFQGPPGTGKTFVADRLARLLASDEEGRVEVVQFHPSYAYEDFVEGIRPVVTEGSALAYEIRKGIFMRLADLAREHPDEPFFLVIDELNRANLPRVLGELLYALEYRGPEHSFRLPYSGTETYLPANIKLIGTMNTADRSIALVDAAIRRRFRHVNFAPDTDVLKAWLKDHDLGQLADPAANRLGALNKQLLTVLDADRLVGHTYLMRPDLGDVGFEAPWEEDIEPVLREHLFNQPGEIVKLRDAFLSAE